MFRESLEGRGDPIGAPVLERRDEVPLTQGMTRNDLHDRIHGGEILSQHQVPALRRNHGRDLSQDAHRPDQAVLIRPLDPFLRRRSHGQVEMDLVGSNSAQCPCESVQYFFAIIEILDQHHFDPKPRLRDLPECHQPIDDVRDPQPRPGSVDTTVGLLIGRIERRYDHVGLGQILPHLGLEQQRAIRDHG
jgi:hypothetical protein